MIWFKNCYNRKIILVFQFTKIVPIGKCEAFCNEAILNDYCIKYMQNFTEVTIKLMEQFDTESNKVNVSGMLYSFKISTIINF